MGEVEYVRWRRDHSRSVAAVAEAVEAIDRGDTVEIWFSGHALGQVSGGSLRKKTLPNGKVTITEGTAIPRPNPISLAAHLKTRSFHVSTF